MMLRFFQCQASKTTEAKEGENLSASAKGLLLLISYILSIQSKFNLIKTNSLQRLQNPSSQVYWIVMNWNSESAF